MKTLKVGEFRTGGIGYIDNLEDGKPLTKNESFIYRGKSDVPCMALTPAHFKL